ncbi:Wadjet anti-phage system protein JetD domain-containing protein [Actinomadura mexicana]|uniref:Wadjet anti-phage system protein JetD domain-containing protein n=1 Tax=Actinomadura mexicana TaxID=134959 RepID=UPI000B79052B|nr:Wadjet anti-phage system protein JetD domain-containing protein [Actinomadura mexicana]
MWLHSRGRALPTWGGSGRAGRRATGRPIKASPAILPHLTEAEATAYDTIATAGPTPFRRLEQEAIPLADAATRLPDVSATG